MYLGVVLDLISNSISWASWSERPLINGCTENFHPVELRYMLSIDVEE